MGDVDPLEGKAFWGHEFLTWLWFQSEDSDGEMQVPGVGTVFLWILDRMVLGSLETESKENILREGHVAHSGEAATALQVGKKLQEARFGLARDDREWSFIFKGDTFDLQSVKIPPVQAEDGDDWQATALIRLGEVRECLDVLDALFTEFCRLRVSAVWTNDVLPAMTQWIARKEGG
jgi:recombination associated protein RdgC